MLRAVANMIRSLHLRNSFVKPSFLAFPVFQAIEYRYSIFLVVSRFFQVLSFAFQAFHSLSGTFQVSPLSGPSGTFQDFFQAFPGWSSFSGPFTASSFFSGSTYQAFPVFMELSRLLNIVFQFSGTFQAFPVYLLVLSRLFPVNLVHSRLVHFFLILFRLFLSGSFQTFPAFVWYFQGFFSLLDTFQAFLILFQCGLHLYPNLLTCL